MNNRINRYSFNSSFVILSLVIASLSATSTLWGQPPPITDMAFAPDGKSLVSCSQTGLQVFSWPELQVQKTVEVSFANLHCVVFSPDGNQLAVGGGNPSEYGAVEILSWPECKSHINLSNHDDSVVSVVWRGNKNLISASLDRSMTRWDLKTAAAQISYRGHSRGVSTVCLLDDDIMVTAGHDQSVRVWNVASGKLIRSLNQHTQSVNSMAACPLSSGLPMVATAAGDRTIRFWQPTIGRMMRYIRLESEPLDIAWTSEALLVASCVDGKLRLVDTKNVKVLQTTPMLKGWAYAVAVHPNNQDIAIAGSEGQLFRVTLEKSK